MQSSDAYERPVQDRDEDEYQLKRERGCGR